ncbi:MAG: hypothetical protein J6N21_04090 [Butyrivibrio sp.]|nr:hypothetical protein [Butyrivibrio sp.]
MFKEILAAGCESETPGSISIGKIKNFEIIPSDKYHYNDFHLDDMNAVLRINLHTYQKYDHFDYSVNFIEKTPLKALLEQILDIYNSGENEPDDKMSYDNMLFYSYCQDVDMIPVHVAIRDGKPIPKKTIGYVDGLGLTPIHYAIIHEKYKYARELLYSLSDRNRESFINNDPYGILNYTMATEIIGKYKESRVLDAGQKEERSSERFDLKMELFRRTDIVKKNQSGSVTLSILGAIGKAIFGEVKKEVMGDIQKVNDMANSARNNAMNDAIARQEALVESVRGDYSRWVAENEKLEKMRRSTEINDKEFDEQVAEDIETIKIAASDAASSMTSAIAKKCASGWNTVTGDDKKYSEEELKGIFVDYLIECDHKAREYHDAFPDVNEAFDPRYQALIFEYVNPAKLGERLRTDVEDRVLVLVNKNYYSVPKSFIKAYPALASCEVHRNV